MCIYGIYGEDQNSLASNKHENKERATWGGGGGKGWGAYLASYLGALSPAGQALAGFCGGGGSLLSRRGTGVVWGIWSPQSRALGSQVEYPILYTTSTPPLSTLHVYPHRKFC